METTLHRVKRAPEQPVAQPPRDDPQPPRDVTRDPTQDERGCGFMPGCVLLPLLARRRKKLAGQLGP